MNEWRQTTMANNIRIRTPAHPQTGTITPDQARDLLFNATKNEARQ